MSHPQLPDGLTERELDVLRLVAEGLSNREIGEGLFITANTAANHVRSILSKTGAANRTMAAMYAAEHDLLPRRGAHGRPPRGRTSSGANDPSGESSPDSSMIASAGSPARTAAARIASMSSASYRQNVLRLSADRNDRSQRTPDSSLSRLISAAISALASRRSPN